ncbi:hypothetical protein ACFO3O_16640 [Dokdonia ponticola]|uniref:Uncharacterized protein n=1 Tax=Dokdonia ponticola TaxID=2041041 RepID=A0ABV9I2S6_9FLAO
MYELDLNVYNIVIIASAYGAPYAHLQADQIMERYILPAIL